MVPHLPAASSRQNFTLPDIPELYDPKFLDVLIPPQEDPSLPPPAASPTPKNLMMEALNDTFRQTLTANNAPTYDSTTSPVLNAFQLLSSAWTLEEFDQYLKDSWVEDPQLTLRIIWNVRSIHDGKGNKELFYRAFGWLYRNHPRTAIVNLPKLVEPVCTTPKSKSRMAHGYWKDLLNILALATVDELDSDIINQPSTILHATRQKYQYNRRRSTYGDPATRVAKSLAKDAQNKEVARKKRVVVANERHANLVKKLRQPKFRALYIAIARLFADRLAQDLHILDALDTLGPDARVERIALLRQISWAGKWAPTPMGSHDRYTNIATAIILLLRQSQVPLRYPAALNDTLEPQEAAIILRSFYQRWVLTRLRAVTAVPEPLMSANRWCEIDYNRVPSVCMKNNMEHFFMHDRVAFQKYLVSVEKGHNKISGATLFPHEIVAEILSLGKVPEFKENYEFKNLADFKRSLDRTKVRVAEAQWRTLIDRLRESGSLDNSLAVCDVSGSMGSLYRSSRSRINSRWVPPIIPAISLSLVFASLARPPFNGGFITFSSHPEFVQLNLEKQLYDQIHEMGHSSWSMNTDLQAVFLKLLLPLAIKNKIPQEEMIKRLFIFSDMQFDECSTMGPADWKTTHDVIEEAYKAAGYEMPQIVYWDLSDYGTVEVEGDREGVALMNGFSPAMMKVFMDEDETEWEEIDEKGAATTVKVKNEFNPISVMKKALMKKSFDGLVVVD